MYLDIKLNFNLGICNDLSVVAGVISPTPSPMMMYDSVV